MVHIDPLILVVAPRDRPDLKDEAEHETYTDTFYAWDVIAGRRHPELGGSPEVLDLVNLSIDIYRMEKGEYRFSPRVVDLTALAEAVARDVRAHAETKGVRIEGSEASTASNAPTSLPGRTDPSERYLKVTTDEE